MSKIQPKDGASLWFKNKFGHARLDKKTDTKTTDFKTELAKRLAQRRHKDLEMRHKYLFFFKYFFIFKFSFYNVENEISENEEGDSECEEELSDNELNSNKSKKENVIPLNENEVKNIEVENDKETDVDVSDYEGDEEENVEDEEYTDSEGEKEEEENESVCGEYVPNKKMYVIDDDEDLEEEKSENINLKEVHIQSELVVNQSVVDLFTVEDDDGDNQLDKSIDEAEKEEEDFEEEIPKNVAESKRQNLKEMFDDEASLSGDDIGSDRDEMDDIEGMDEYEAEEGDHDKLNEDEIRDNLIRQYNKYERDADDKRLLKLQEAFFADSDLHNHVGSSDRSFRFRMQGDSKIDWSKIFNIEDGEDLNEEDDGEVEIRREKRIKILEWQLEQNKKGIKRKFGEIDNSDNEEEEENELQQNGVNDQQINSADLDDDSNVGGGGLFQLGEQILFGKENELSEKDNNLNGSTNKNLFHSVQLPTSSTTWRKKDSLIDRASNLEVLFKNGDINEITTKFGTESFNSLFQLKNI
ncbi:unnamed protein product [Meloidogyne enterolobii]|uniref:Uncharacterized protein n=1 Tax=Meloidogyne enterolobii TaxID=390850 RepID=A0ACB0Y1I0_MELEN